MFGLGHYQHFTVSEDTPLFQKSDNEPAHLHVNGDNEYKKSPRS